MARIEVSRVLSADRGTVWAALSDLESHASWMADAESVEFVGDRTTGPGTVMRVPTRVGPFRTVDIIEITDWADGERIDADHRGLVSGSGSFVLREHNAGTQVTWTESLTFPWWLGGAIGAALAKPILRRIWTGNLRRLEASLNAP